MFKKDHEMTDEELTKAFKRDIILVAIGMGLCLGNIIYIIWQYYTL